MAAGADIIGLVAVVGFYVVVILALGMVMLLWLVRTAKGKTRSSHDRPAKEEAQIIQEIYQGMQKMESRIETLETLMTDTERKDG